MRLLIILAMLLVTVAASRSQQQGAPPEMQYLIQAIEGQRNMALTMHANAEARAGALQQENTKLKAELEKLKAPAGSSPEEKPK